MGELTPTFVFEGSTVLAFLGEEVIAQGTDIEQVEQEANERAKIRAEQAEQESREASKRTATHVVTPNGVKGQLLGRVAGLWGEQVTARMENGEVVKFYVTGHERWENENHKTASSNPIVALRERLDSDYSHDKTSLIARLDELKTIRRQAGDLIIKGASFTDSTQLDQLRVLADAEIAEVSEALDHLNQVDDAIAPPSIQPQVVEQASVGVRDDGSTWLEAAADEIIQENSNQDFEQLLSEGPTLLVAELPDAALADAGNVREIALSHIASKTAGIDAENIDDYRNAFLARCEEERRVQLSRRTKEVRQEVTAAVDDTEVPDEALFV
jgi:hypothetical protein